ncbi:MAG: methionine adenosyltransferase domain-containing protein, partial [SAR324 cluster bacterium]|nr:methionine adenosyltransferase domain-containing protein [SAR324 cluster bacterium]
AAGLVTRCEVQLAYAIGFAEPVSITVDTYVTGIINDNRIAALVREIFKLKPAEIIETLDMLRPIYKKTAAYGHFGRELPEFRWENVDKVEDLRRAMGR